MKIAEGKGEVIEMRGDPGDFFVRGHVSDTEALKAVAEYACGIDEDFDAGGLYPFVYHVWGRWVNSWPPYEEYEALWNWCDRRVPGYARVTRVRWSSDVQKEEESKAVAYRAEQIARDKFPNAVRIEVVNPWHWDMRHNVCVKIDLKHSVVEYRPWDARYKAIAKPKNWKMPRSVWMELDGLRPR